MLYVCLGGGGLTSGSALSARALAPACKIYGVEPEAGNDGQQSLRAGRIVHIETPKTIGNFFGYSTIVFDFVRRAMPFSQPRTLTGDEVYAATAYLLWLNKIIGENDVMDAKTLPQVKMPNRDGFIIRFPDKI